MASDRKEVPGVVKVRGMVSSSCFFKTALHVQGVGRRQAAQVA